jgi:hypothetical protein
MIRKAVTKEYRQQKVGDRVRRLHRLRAEAAVGHPLPSSVQVHHVDGSKSDHSALVICQDQAYHMLLHVRTRVLRAGGNPNTDRICTECHRVKPMTAFSPCKCHRAGLGNQCKTCKAEKARLRLRRADKVKWAPVRV